MPRSIRSRSKHVYLVQGRAPGFMGLAPERSVTFVDNHDTGVAPGGQGMWPFPSESLGAGYAYILTHPGGRGILSPY